MKTSDIKMKQRGLGMCNNGLVRDTDYARVKTAIYFSSFEALDYEGEVQTRTKSEYPYSYGPHLIWVKNNTYLNIDYMGAGKGIHAVYSDRLYEWDAEKYNRAAKEAFGDTRQHFHNQPISQIQKFISAYEGKEVELVKFGEECNQSSGFPLWVFWYRTL